MQTADEALGGRDVPRLVLPALGDPDYGAFEGGRLEDYRAWARGRSSAERPPGGGESRQALVARYLGAWRSLLARPEETLLVVCHSLPIAYVLAARDGEPPAPIVPLVAYATPYPFAAAELERACDVLADWLSAPTW